MIRFDCSRLPILYEFKSNVIELCLTYIKDVIKSSSNPKPKGLHQKLKEIETDLYDIFCRWNFNALRSTTFDIELFLPTHDFIMMTDIAYYVRRFNIVLEDSIVSFPINEYNTILQKASESATPVTPIKNTVTCSEKQLQRIRSIYTGTSFDTDVQKIISRYMYLGGLNNSLSTPPNVLSLYPSHELFGTPLNTCGNYCSPFEDEKDVFNSHGSFFTFSNYKEDVIYFANPPFDDVFCTTMTDKLLVDLEKRLFSLIVIIPVWDTLQQQKYGLTDFKLPFECYNRLVNSPYFLSEVFLDKKSYPFYNYFHDKYVMISNTHMINLGKPVDMVALQHSWSNCKK